MPRSKPCACRICRLTRTVTRLAKKGTAVERKINFGWAVVSASGHICRNLRGQLAIWRFERDAITDCPTHCTVERVRISVVRQKK